MQKLVYDDEKKCYRFEGAGFFSNLKQRILPRKAESARLTNFLDGQGSQKVIAIELARKPVLSGVRQALNVVSFGAFDKAIKKLGYDNIYHNYLMIKLADGTWHRLEKNHQVEVRVAQPDDLVKDRTVVPIPHDLSLKEMLSKASTGDDKFWTYDARDSNCQDFTRSMIEKNGLQPLNPPIQQDAKSLTEVLPFKGAVAKKITDLAQYGDQVITGGSIISDLKLNSWF